MLGERRHAAKQAMRELQQSDKRADDSSDSDTSTSSSSEEEEEEEVTKIRSPGSKSTPVATRKAANGQDKELLEAWERKKKQQGAKEVKQEARAKAADAVSSASGQSAEKLAAKLKADQELQKQLAEKEAWFDRMAEKRASLKKNGSPGT